MSEKPQRIPVSGPWITEKEISYVTEAVKEAWYEKANEFPSRFERAFEQFLGVKHAIALPSCTSAIHLALAALGIKHGDEVIVPEITWIASAAPVTYVGATTVFADVDPRTWCLAPDSFEQCITPKTRAVIPVDLYGNVADYNALRRIANAHGIAIIEDAAEAVGGEYEGARAGSLGETGVFSFHGSKTLTTGEGGLLATNSDDIWNRAMQLRDHGRRPGDRFFFNTEIGFKYKMSALQAALGLAQLERLEELIDRKRQIFGWYQEALKDISEVTLNFEAPGTRSTYWMVTAVWDERLGVGKEKLQDSLAHEGIDCRPFFYPLSQLPAYRERPEAAVARDRNRVSYSISPRGINLPSALNLTQEQVRRVCGAFLKHLGLRVAVR